MQRETLWWNEAVQRAVQEKKRVCKRWCPENIEDEREYKEKVKQAKRDVARAKRLAW